MSVGIVLTTVVFFALLFATVAGFVAARVLMYAAETRSPQGGESDDR